MSEETAPGSQTPTWGPSTTAMLLCLLGIFAWRVFFTAWVGLVPDECSYWAWSRRLDWSYFDNSGMVAYLIRASTSLFGEHTPFAVRFPFLALSFLGTFLIFRVGMILFEDQRCALLAALVMNLTPVALLGGSTAIHDNALIFFWMLCLWATSRFIKTLDGRWFYVMGVCSGLAILSKYTGVLLLLSLLLFLVWSKDHRGWLMRREPWLGALLALLFTAPILWWNFRHDWASLHHILYIGSGYAETTRRILDGVGYHAAQFLLVSPPIYIALLASLGSGTLRTLSENRSEYVLLLSFSLPLLLFGVMCFKGHVEANWAFMGYVSAAILAVQVVSSAWAAGSQGPWKWFNPRFLRWAAIIAVVPVMLAVLHAWIGLLPAFLEKRLGKADRIIYETRGWSGLGEHVAALKMEGDVIAADSYQLCAILEFYVPGNPKVRYLAPWNRPTQFDVWEPSFDNLKGRNILFVSSRPLEPSSKVLMTVYENFARVEPLASYQVKYHKATIREVHLCRGFDFNPHEPRELGPRSLFYKDH